MTTDEIKIMINNYFDGELAKGNEPILFTQLSLDEEAREYFKSLNSLKEIVQADAQNFPAQLEERILYSIESKIAEKSSFAFWKNPFALVSYGFAVFLLIISLFFYSESIEYKKELKTSLIQVNQQSHMINLLMNSLPSATVEGEVENEIIIENTRIEKTSL